MRIISAAKKNADCEKLICLLVTCCFVLDNAKSNSNLERHNYSSNPFYYSPLYHGKYGQDEEKTHV